MSSTTPTIDVDVIQNIFIELKKLKDKHEYDIDQLEQRINQLEEDYNELRGDVNMDVLNKTRGNQKSRSKLVYDYLQKDTSRSCLNTDNILEILGSDIKQLSQPSKTARSVMMEMSQIYPDIEYYGGQKGRGHMKSSIKIIR